MMQPQKRPAAKRYAIHGAENRGRVALTWWRCDSGHVYQSQNIEAVCDVCGDEVTRAPAAAIPQHTDTPNRG